jgi:hypothetical protein
MALQACRECGQQVSTQARRCPHCGAKRPTTNLFWLGARRWLAVIGLLAAMAYCTAPPDSRPRVQERSPQTPDRSFPNRG